MTAEEFKAPLKYLAGALGAEPREPLIAWLRDYYMGSLEAEVWKRACRSLAHGIKPAHFILAQDFIRAVSQARSDLVQEDRKKDAHAECRQGLPLPIRDSIETMAELGEKTGSPFLQRLAQDLRRRRRREPEAYEEPSEDIPF